MTDVTATILTDPEQVTVQVSEWIVDPNDPARSIFTSKGKLFVVNIPASIFVRLAATGSVAPPAPTPAPAPGVVAEVLLPGSDSAIRRPDGSLLTIGATGAVYLDGVQMGTTMARQMVAFGVSIFVQGLTNPLWWRWVNGGWQQVTAFDNRVLTDLP